MTSAPPEPTEPVEPANLMQPATTDDPDRNPGAEALEGVEDANPDTDDMGIDDDDPIDATLVGGPLESTDDDSAGSRP